ncbi:hypothetical protein MtrunA17_Chr8g0367881 [Medicago truncatula]|uniref:Uncharacterized protein n=1 Tax=Medicago truncatula TaxID=3880 RepID=B7FH71_MEDTR|nr:uncharacterized protein LOC112417011 [Medicago truncatula]ACJ84100.1 unknown [Medicago truncatula]AFK44907.1 unknown [Medicago truncatula]RHN41608.1 hypothetical protein MtrunA17_Chr8g0367881 [Medicago truncatula]
METKIPAKAVTATKVLVIENAAEGASAPGCPGVAPPGPDAGTFEPGAGGEKVFGLGLEPGEEEVEGETAGEGVGDFVEGDGAGAEFGDNCVGAGAGACARHDVAKSPNITNNLIDAKPMLYMFFEREECLIRTKK